MIRSRLVGFIAMVAVVAAAIPACSLFWQDDDIGDPNVPLGGTEWVLQRIFLSGVVLDAARLDEVATLRFSRSTTHRPSRGAENGTFDGYTGCNAFSGNYESFSTGNRQGTLALSNLVHTEKACSGIVAQIDGANLAGLQHAATYVLDRDMLRIQVAADAPAPALTLVFLRVR